MCKPVLLVSCILDSIFNYEHPGKTTYVILANSTRHQDFTLFHISQVVDPKHGIIAFTTSVRIQLLDFLHILSKDILSAGELERAVRMGWGWHVDLWT